ncbi:CotH kinase family protein [Streptomyces sp. NPDC003691]
MAAGLVAMVHFLGDARIAPYVTSSSRVEADAITENVTGKVGLYDTSVPHSVRLTYRQTDFDAMMKEFREDGTKEYIEADLVIDGVRLDDVGIRLKGNSTLMSLRGGRGGAPEGLPGGGAGRAAGAGPGGAGGGGAAGPGGGGAGGAGGEPGGAGAPGGGGGMVRYELSAAEPEELPWLVKIDEYVEGRAYQGEREISLRPGSDAQVPLNEALSLSLTAAGGQQAERYAFTEVRVNDRPAVTRLMVENPDTDYAGDLGGDAVLYKAKAGGSFAYRGDDPTAYESSFEQLNRKGSQDLEPVMKLIGWADRASDEEFARDLDEYVDIGSLASYLATQNLLLNFDDMAGPGKNYLLRYDLGTRKFTVLGWDYNLSFGGDTAAGPDDTLGMGRGMPGGTPGAGAGQPGAAGQAGAEGAPDTGGGAPSGAPDRNPEPPGDLPEPPGGMPEPPGRMPGGGGGDATGDVPPGGPPDRAGGAVGAMGHPLKTRFLELDAFDEVYLTAYKKLYRQFYASGAAAGQARAVADMARAAGGGSAELDTAADRLVTTVTARAAALAGNEKVTG